MVELNQEAKQCLMALLSNMAVEQKEVEMIPFEFQGRNYCLRIKIDGNKVKNMDLLIPCGDLWLVVK